MSSARYDGTVAIWYTSHSQVYNRDWRNIENFKGAHHPRLGYYDHATRDTLLKHLHWLRRAGVDAIVYDVFAMDRWNPGDIEKDRVLPWLAEALEDQSRESRRLQLIIWLERYAENPSLEEYRHALRHIRERYTERPYYFRHAGKPLAVTYLNGDSQAIDQLEWENDYFTLRRIRPYHSDVWSYIEHWPQRLNRQWMSACPGMDPYLENAYLARKKDPKADLAAVRKSSVAADREDGEYFRKQLRRAREGQPDIIFISGWNDWQYGCQIEPAVEYGFKYVDLAAEMLGRKAETAPYRTE